MLIIVLGKFPKQKQKIAHCIHTKFALFEIYQTANEKVVMGVF